ncbi:MAG: hypothetical protein Q8J69_04145 [Sphingobacteriaceae bacterium]|nr:hypothetical protein [Sphingobacteriaceae bacterium]
MQTPIRLERLNIEIANISDKTKYWLIRTDKGQNFHTFVENGFVGIGWNTITTNVLQNKSVEEIKLMISKDPDIGQRGADLSTAKGKSLVTSTLNKIKLFQNMKFGDVVIIPSAGGEIMAFGEINDDEIFTETGNDCSYSKRRKVSWITKVDFKDLDSKFLKFRPMWSAITDVSNYNPYIDRVMYPLFVRGSRSHLILNHTTHNELNLVSFNEFVSEFRILLKRINEDFELNEDIDQIFIKINVQSKGLAEIIKVGQSLLILSIMLQLSSCSPEERATKPVESQELYKLYRPASDSLNQRMLELSMPINNKN